MNGSRDGVRALYLALMLVVPLVGFPFVHPVTMTVGGETLRGANSASPAGPSPSVSMPGDLVVTGDTNSDFTVNFDVSGEGVAAGNLQVQLIDTANPNPALDTVTPSATSGSETLTIDSADVSSDFQAQVSVVEVGASTLATDSASVSVRNPGNAPGVDIVDQTFNSGQQTFVDVGYDLTGTAAGNDLGNVDIVLVDAGSSTDIASTSPGTKKGAVTLSFTRSSTFTGQIEVRHDGPPEATDTATYTASGGGPPGGGPGSSCHSPSNGNPGACINVSSYIVEDGTQLSFDGSGSDDDGSIASYAWDFDKSGNTDATGATATHTYSGTGTYDAQLTVTDNDGNTDSVSVPINVQSTWPVQNTDVSVSTTSIENGSGTATDRQVTVSYDTGAFSGNAELTVMSMRGQFASQRTTVSSSGNSATVTIPQFSPTQQPTLILFMQDSHTFGYSGFDEELAFGTGCVDIADGSGGTYFQCPEVTSSEVTTADVTALSDVAVDASLGNFGMVDVTLHEKGDASNLDLASGSISDSIDADTTLWVNYTVEGAHPGALMGRAEMNSWEATNVTTGSTITYEVNASLTPIEMYRNTSVGVSDPNRWPTDQGKATEVNSALVDFSMMDLNMMPGSAQDDFEGATLTTDAQVYRPPQYSPGGNGQSASLSMPVAGPHYETDGSTQNTGFYDAVIPSGILDAWGIDASSLTGTYQGQEVQNMQITERDNGNVHVRMDIHYSNGTITLKPGSQPSPNPTPTPTPTPEPSDSGGSSTAATATPTPTPTPTATPSPTDDEPTPTPEPADTEAPTERATEEQPDTPTPTEETGPGFGAFAALAAVVLGVALLARRR